MISNSRDDDPSELDGMHLGSDLHTCVRREVTHKSLPFTFIFFFFSFGHMTGSTGFWFLDQVLNLCPLQWKHGNLTTEPPGKSLIFIFVNLFLPLKVQHLPVGTAERGLKLSGSSNLISWAREVHF